jgi:hypothetical protein
VFSGANFPAPPMTTHSIGLVSVLAIPYSKLVAKQAG